MYDTKFHRKAFRQIKIFSLIHLFKAHLIQKTKEEEEEVKEAEGREGGR